MQSAWCWRMLFAKNGYCQHYEFQKGSEEKQAAKAAVLILKKSAENFSLVSFRALNDFFRKDYPDNPKRNDNFALDWNFPELFETILEPTLKDWINTTIAHITLSSMDAKINELGEALSIAMANCLVFFKCVQNIFLKPEDTDFLMEIKKRIIDAEILLPEVRAGLVDRKQQSEKEKS